MEKRLPRIHIIIVALICLLFTAVSGFVVYSQTVRWNRFKQTAIETTAEITDISTHRSGTGKHKKTHRTVKVRYTVDGKEYNTKLGYYTAGMHKGSTVKLYYDPADPSKSMSDPKMVNIVLTVLAVLFLIISIAIVTTELKQCTNINRLISNDQYYLCNDWIEETAPVTVNKVRYHQIKCNITDDRGNVHTFVSPAFNPNKSPYKPGDSIKVYVDLFEAPDNYYISKYPV